MANNAGDRDPNMQRESFTELLGQLARNSAAVVHDEIELVIQRLRDKMKASRSGVVLLAVGAAIGFAAFMALCAALIIGLTGYMHPIMAALVTGGSLAIICVVLIMIGYRQLKNAILRA